MNIERHINKVKGAKKVSLMFGVLDFFNTNKQ